VHGTGTSLEEAWSSSGDPSKSGSADVAYFNARFFRALLTLLAVLQHSHAPSWEKRSWMDFHSPLCSQAAPGMLCLPPAVTQRVTALPRQRFPCLRPLMGRETTLLACGHGSCYFFWTGSRMLQGKATRAGKVLGQDRNQANLEPALGAWLLKKRKKREIKTSCPRFADSVMTQVVKFSYPSAQWWGERLLVSP